MHVFRMYESTIQIVDSTTQEANNYSSQLFSVNDENKLLIHPSCKSSVPKQTLLPIKISALKCFPREMFAKTLKVTNWFPRNTTSKIASLAVCLYIDKTMDLHEVNWRALFGGNIGAGDSLLHHNLTFFTKACNLSWFLWLYEKCHWRGTWLRLYVNNWKILQKLYASGPICGIFYSGR